jgi:hypothetical protein
MTGALSAGFLFLLLLQGEVVARGQVQLLPAGRQMLSGHVPTCIVTIPGGGLVPEDEEFPFLAPDTGYQPSAEINMPADQNGWQNDVDLNFYYQLADGNYGRMTFSMIAGGQHFFMINSVLNPSGSQNLEPQ